MSTISHADFLFVKKLVQERAAIMLEAGKEYLVASRLNTLAREETHGVARRADRRAPYPAHTTPEPADRRGDDHQRDVVLPRRPTVRRAAHGHPA